MVSNKIMSRKKPFPEKIYGNNSDLPDYLQVSKSCVNSPKSHLYQYEYCTPVRRGYMLTLNGNNIINSKYSKFPEDISDKCFYKKDGFFTSLLKCNLSGVTKQSDYLRSRPVQNEEKVNARANCTRNHSIETYSNKQKDLEKIKIHYKNALPQSLRSIAPSSILNFSKLGCVKIARKIIEQHNLYKLRIPVSEIVESDNN